MKFKITSIILFIALFGCQEKPLSEEGTGQGWLSVACITDQSVIARSSMPGYYLEIKQNGSVVHKFDCFTSTTEPILLKTGIYQLSAFSGKDSTAGFDIPFYKNEQEIRIESAVTKEITMICTQANVKIDVNYSDKIKKNFSSYYLEVTNGIGTLIFGKDEKRTGYLQVNPEGTLVWNLYLDNGQEKYQLTKTIVNVAPRHQYRFSFDIQENGNENDGAFIPGIVVDTTTDVFDWVCNVVLKDSIAKPTIEGYNFNITDPVNILEGKRGASIVTEITALARIEELKLLHHSSELEKWGIPRSITLSNINSETAAAIRGAGISWTEPILDAQYAQIDFSDLCNKLPLGEYQFTIQIYDAHKRLIRQALNVQVIPDIDHIALAIPSIDVWATFATLSGQWYTVDKPTGMSIEYSTDETTWTKIPEKDLDATGKIFTARLTRLTPSTLYYYRTVSDNFTSPTVLSFTTEAAEQIPYMNFDTWHMEGKAYYPGPVGTRYWDSGNEGGAGFGFNPTTEETSDVIKGSAARLASTYAVVKFAAGNLYTGDFVKLDVTNAELDFGIPYSGRPTTLSGWLKYNPGKIDRTKAPYDYLKDQADSCHIYIALCDWSTPFRVITKNNTFVDLSENNKSILALGELKTNKKMDSYEHFTININYRDLTRKPTYILIVATASKYGDYFTGSTSSVLLIDEFELGFDPIE